MNLQNRVAIVTGAGRGIGRALAREFARQGMKVVAAARTQADVDETAQTIREERGQCLPLAVDVTRKDQIAAMVEQTLATFGQIDVLFNNAARIPVISGLWEVDAEAWWEEVTVNLRGPMLCARAVLEPMMQRNSGTIINMTGGSNIPGRTSYCCSKVAIGRLTQLMARELAAVGSAVVVFEMGPGLVKSKRTLVEATTKQGIRWNPNTRQQFEQGHDRPPEDCARAAVKLLRQAGPQLAGKTFQTAEVLAESWSPG